MYRVDMFEFIYPVDMFEFIWTKTSATDWDGII